MASVQRACLLLIMSMWFGLCGCNYTDTCSGMTLSGTSLSATCTAVDGSSVTSIINLNDAVGNNNGRLVCGSNFSASCSNAGLSGGHTLVANCKNTQGTLIQSTIDLNDCICNNNGHLQPCLT